MVKVLLYLELMEFMSRNLLAFHPLGNQAKFNKRKA